MTHAIPEVSVIMPVRNGAETIGDSLESLLRQTLGELEVIVVDDGSTDATPEILRKFADQDARIRVVRREPTGIVAALRAGVDAAQSPLIARLDADDLAYPARLETQRDQFVRHPQLVLLGTAVDVINWRGEVTGQIEYPSSHGQLKCQMAKRNPLVHSTIMMRKAAYEQVGGYRSALQMAEDYDLWCRLSECGQIANLPHRLGAYRKGPQTYSNTSRFRQMYLFSAARCAALHRESGRPDPFLHVDVPLSLDGPCPAELQAEWAFFRQLRKVASEAGERPTWDDCVALIEMARDRSRHERRLVQDAVLSLCNRHDEEPIAGRQGTALVRCLQLDLWRLPLVARRLWKRSAA